MTRTFTAAGTWLVFTLLSLALVSAAVAQEVAPATGPLALQLDQAIAMALDQSPAVKAATYQALSARDKASAVNRTHWGALDAVASVSRFEADRLLVPMTSQLLAGGLHNAPFDRDQIHYGLTYQIPLYLGGKLSAGIEMAKLEAAKADALRDGTTWQVRFNVVSLYAGVQALDGALTASGELIQTLAAVHKRLELMVEQGKRPELDLLKVQDELAEAQAEQAGLQARRVQVASMLLALLGQSPYRPLIVTPLSDFAPELTVSADSLRTLAGISSPVRRAEFSQDQADSGIKAARSEFLPSIVGQASYFGHHADAADGSDPTTWSLSLGVKLPLFNGTSRFKEMSAAKASQRAAEEGLTMAHLQRQAELNDALARLQAARMGLQAATARVAAATEAARSEQIRYDSGASSIEDLLRAKTRAEAANTALASARGELKIAAEQINAVVETEVLP